MGWTYEVEAYVKVDGYQYMTTWTGESLFAAVRAMREARKNGVGAIRLTWRPT